jgi:uncharacterized OB-fold protein
MSAASTAIDVTAGHWRVEPDGPSLVGSRCPACKKCAFPRREFCDGCGNEVGMETVALSRTGVLYSYTIVRVAPQGFTVPYTLGFIDLPEDVRILAQIESDKDLSLGDELELFVGPIRHEADGSLIDGYKFRRVARP